MFQRPSSFNNLRFGTKLRLAFGLLVVVAIIISVVSAVAANLASAAAERANAAQKDALLARTVQAELNNAHTAEEKYFLYYPSEGLEAANRTYMAAHQTHANAGLDAIASMWLSSTRSELENQERIDELKQIQALMLELEADVSTAVADTKTRGLADSGLEGKMRNLAQALEADPALTDPAIQVTLLTMRQNEKDYFLRGDKQYLDLTHAANATLQNQISALDIPYTLKNPLLNTANDYLKTFDALAEMDVKIAAEKDSSDATIGSIEQIATKIAADEQNNAEASMAELATIQRDIQIVQIILLVSALVSGFVLTALLTSALTSQVAEIQNVFRAAAIGNFDARAKVLGGDELGQTAEGVNAMLERLTEFMGVAAQAARQRFSDVVTTLSDWVWEVDAEGHYTYCSEQVVDVLGYTAEEMIGKSPFDFMPPEEAQRVAPLFGEFLAAKAPITDLENKNVRKDGREVYLVTNGVPMLDSKGDLRGYRGTDKDITDRRLAEERIRESEATLRGVFDNMQDAFYRTDRQGRIIWASASAARMMGYDTPEEVVGLDTATSFWAHPDQRDAMLQVLNSAGKVTDYEVEVRRKDGSSFPVSTSSSYYREASGQIAGVEGAFRDITERKQAEEAVRSSERLLRSIIDATKDWIFLKDSNYRYMVVNEAFAYEYGRLTAEEMIGKDDYDLGTPAYLIEGDPERGIRGFRVDDRAVVEDRQTITNPYDVVNFRDGTEHVFHTVKAPLQNSAGNIIGVLGVSRDVTERKHAEDQVKLQNEALARTLEELRGLMAGVESAAGQVTGASGDLQGVMELIAGQAVSSAEIAEQATGSAQEGGRAVTDTVSAMGRIRETSQETARRIKRLGEVSQEIGEVVRLIDEIADRVTVLALNASIQAAAAGDAGRGFAVVAEEVQRLAERATGATRQIENLIKGVQGEINEAMVSVEEVTQEVVGGSQLAQNAGDRMTELNRVVNDLSSLIQHIAQTTSRQTSESLATLTALAEDLRSSVAALRTPETEYAGGNGYGDAAPTSTTN